MLCSSRSVFDAYRYICFQFLVTFQLSFSESGWFKANVGQTGFYRVNYDEENWKGLSQQLLHNHTVRYWPLKSTVRYKKRFFMHQLPLSIFVRNPASCQTNHRRKFSKNITKLTKNQSRRNMQCKAFKFTRSQLDLAISLFTRDTNVTIKWEYSWSCARYKRNKQMKEQLKLREIQT